MTTTLIADFGLAKATATGSKYTRTGQAIGTPAYMSPEQARGETATLTAATDVWGLGCILYELLAGRPAFGGETTAEVIAAVLSREPARLAAVRPDVPSGLDAVVRVSLGKFAGHRYTSAREFASDLDRVLRGERPSARPHRRRAPAVAAAVALAAAAVAVAVAGRTPPPEPAPTVAPHVVEAGGLASQAERLRRTEPAAAADLLGRALAITEADAATLRTSRDGWRIARGLCLWSAGRGAEARAEWDRVGSGSPQAARAALYRALEALARQDAHVAGPDLEALTRASDPAGALARGTLAALRLDWTSARRELRAATGWEASLIRGYVETLAPDPDPLRAVREYGAALAEGPPLAWVFLHRGVAHQDLRNLPDALADFERALALEPGLAAAWANRGRARGAQGDADGELTDYDRALELDPTVAVVWHNRALARGERGDTAGALEDWARALAIRPAYPEALASRGATRAATGDPVGALEDCDRAIALAPDLSRAFDSRAMARRRLGDLAGALADHERALALAPQQADLYFQRGNTRVAAGDTEGAITDWTRTLELDPDHVRAAYVRGKVRQDAGDVAGALADYDRILVRRPDFADASANRGLLRQFRGDLPGAIADFEAALSSTALDRLTRARIETSLAAARAALAGR